MKYTRLHSNVNTPAPAGDAPLVSICAVCYNHAPYLKEALDHFLSQKCSFRFEILIHDDESTDGSQDIIRAYQARYPDIIKPILQAENFRRDFQTFDVIGHLAQSDVGAVLVAPDGMEYPMKAQGWNND